MPLMSDLIERVFEPIKIFHFTNEQFDSGEAHEIVNRYVSENADTLPGSWVEYWYYSLEWVCRIYNPND